MIWNQPKECMGREQMRALQGERLHKPVRETHHNMPFYRRKMQEMDVTPDDIRTVDDVVKLPFTTSRTFGITIRTGFSPFRCRRSCACTPLRVRRALPPWARLYPPRFGHLVGDDRPLPERFRDRLQRHLFGGVRLRSVYRRIGVALWGGALRGDRHSDVERQYGEAHQADTRFRSDCYHLHSLIRPLPGRSDGPGRDSPGGVPPGKPVSSGPNLWTENMRREIETKMGVNAYNIYGLSEVMGPGCRMNAPARTGRTL